MVLRSRRNESGQTPIKKEQLPSYRPNFKNKPKGKILLALRQYDGTTWRVQLASVKTREGDEEIRFNVRHWDMDGYPMAGLENGFPLLVREAEKLIKALQDGLRLIESGEITSDD
jgi:hypothetical protein